jgi:hypothetical protein
MLIGCIIEGVANAAVVFDVPFTVPPLERLLLAFTNSDEDKIFSTLSLFDLYLKREGYVLG